MAIWRDDDKDEDGDPSCNNIHQLMPNKDIIILASAFLPRCRRGPTTVSVSFARAKRIQCESRVELTRVRLEKAIGQSFDDGRRMAPAKVDEDIFRTWTERDRISNSNSQPRFIGTFPPLCTRLARRAGRTSGRGWGGGGFGGLFDGA